MSSSTMSSTSSSPSPPPDASSTSSLVSSDFLPASPSAPSAPHLTRVPQPMSTVYPPMSTFPSPTADLSPEHMTLLNEFLAHPSVVTDKATQFGRQRECDAMRQQKFNDIPSPEAAVENELFREWDWQHEAQRWLRAAKWNVEKAVKRFRDCVLWRGEHKVDYLLANFPHQRHDLLDLIVPSGVFGFSKLGQPAYWERTGKTHMDALLQLFNNSPGVQEVAHLHCCTQEILTARCKEQSRRLGKNIDTILSIVDMTGLSVAHRRGVNIFVDVMTFDEKYYPERMGALYAINCPRIFPILYAIVKPLLDPVTASKINVVSGPPYLRLTKDFDKDQIPTLYGGTLAEPPSFLERSLDHLQAILKSTEPLAEDLTIETVKAGKKIEKVLEGKAGDVFAYYVKTTKEDLQIHMQFESTAEKNTATIKRTSEWNTFEVVPKGRYDTSKLSQSGEYVLPSTGKIKVLLDNSYSYFTAKEVHYWVEVGSAGAAGADAPKDDETEKKETGAADDADGSAGVMFHEDAASS